MQVVFVHGVSARDLPDGNYERLVEGRTDRLNRLAFAGRATIRNPYWGKFGHAETTLKSIPTAKGTAEALGLFSKAIAPAGPNCVAAAKLDLRAVVASLSAQAIHDATSKSSESERRKIEDDWVAAAKFVDARPVPAWLSQITSLSDLMARLGDEVAATRPLSSLGSNWLTQMRSFDINDFAADRARKSSSGLLAQFLGDAMMFFARRDSSDNVRQEIATNIVDAASAAKALHQPLVLIGHSMGGSILHEMLTDPEQIAAIEVRLKQSLAVDLFLGVGTQIGLFAELGQFAIPEAGEPLAVPSKHYWNVYDYVDTLAFACAPILPRVVDFEVTTAGGVFKSHTAYFDNALFFSRLNDRLRQAGLLN